MYVVKKEVEVMVMMKKSLKSTEIPHLGHKLSNLGYFAIIYVFSRILSCPFGKRIQSLLLQVS